MAERWPPIYDAEDLAAVIQKVAGSPSAASIFEGGRRVGPPVCQGDVVRFPNGVPVFDEEGSPVVLDPEVEHWLVVGNTCDFAREISEAAWTQIVPIIETVPLDEVDRGTRIAFESYQYSRRFYVPPWPGASSVLRYADFLTPVGTHKRAVGDSKVVARMNREGWVLLHSCLVRFLCRDDGRFG